MQLTKSETNNCIVVQLQNVRPHSNADRLKLATVLGTQVVVGLDAKEGDVCLYFDSNLALSAEYLRANNLYAHAEINVDPSKKGYFGNNGKVKAQKFRGEMSNGYVAELCSLTTLDGIIKDRIDFCKVGDEFTHVDGVEICRKYIVPQKMPGTPGNRNRTRKPRYPQSPMFKEHWDTKQLMRVLDTIPEGVVYIEEKAHGSSGRTGHMLCKTHRPWWQFWKLKEVWQIISGTRRRDNIRGGHMWQERQEIEDKLRPHLHKGETVYYEIFGHTKSGAEVQSGFSYSCVGGEYKVMLYRVTITTLDNHTYDLPRNAVYHRADELGLMKPIVIEKVYTDNAGVVELARRHVHGNSAIANHMKEGVVVWWQNQDGTMSNAKMKSDEFLELESKQRDQEIGDVEDVL